MATPTITDVADRAGVSIATVSRVYNSPDSVRESTRSRVLQAAQALNYSPNLAARALSLQRTNLLGVILPDLGGEFFSELIRSIDMVVSQHGFHLMISASHSHRNEVELLLQLMSQGWVDGLILMVPVLGRLTLPVLEKINIPIVLINLPENHPRCININIDNYRGAYLATTHLLEHGYAPVAMIRGPAGNFDADTREQGFVAALTERNQPAAVDGVSYLERGDFTRRSGYLAMSRLLGLARPPRAVFVANDDMAIGAYDAAQQLGIHIPEQVAIAGFDDIDVASCVRPSLTTVHVPIHELGTTAAEKLITAIAAPEATSPEERLQMQVLPTGLLIRESCGCNGHSRIELNRDGR